MAAPDRVKLDLAFDPTRMREDVLGLPLHDFVEYSVLPLTAPIPKGNRAVANYADGSWATWTDTDLLQACPYLSSIVEKFRSHTTVTLVRLLRLAPRGLVAEHTDPTLGLEQEASVIRLTVPIITNDEARLFLNDEPVPLRPGECWYLRFTDPHRVENNGETERIHLSIDMIPNEWVRSEIASAESQAPGTA